MTGLLTGITLIAFAAAAMPLSAQNTVVGIRGSVFTINGQPTYAAQAGFPNANPNLIGTLLNVRAVQAIFARPTAW